MLSPSFCGQESGHDLARWLWFKVSYLATECRSELWLEAPLGKNPLPSSAMCTQVGFCPWGLLHWGPWFFAGSWLETSLSSLPRSLSTGYLQPHHFGHIVFVRKESFWASAQSWAGEPSQKLLTSIRLPFFYFYFIFWPPFLSLYVNSAVLFLQKWTSILWSCEESGSFKGKMNSLKSHSASHHCPCYCFMSKFSFVIGR